MKSSWNSLIEYYFGDISVNMNYQSSDDIIYPSNDIIFKCFDYFDISQTRVVIIGQDPYHQAGQATGLAFGVNIGITVPPSFDVVDSVVPVAVALPGFTVPSLLKLTPPPS